MALNVTNIKRQFKHKENDLPDPATEMAPHEVLAFYANTYPELTTATVHGPEVKDGVAIYEFKTNFGPKG